MNPFVKRNYNYALRHLKTGAARVYVQNQRALQAAGFFKNLTFSVTRKAGRIEVRLDPKGNMKVMDTGRGELVELKNKSVAQTFPDITLLTVTFRKGVIIFSVPKSVEAKLRREHRIIKKLGLKQSLACASLFSGLGMLSYHLKRGLMDMGHSVEMVYANDMEDLALELNVAHNPIWDNAHPDAIAECAPLSLASYDEAPESDIMEIGYPCVGFSALARAENLDLNHPHCGTLFIDVIHAIRHFNPAIVIFENVPGFGSSTTLELIQRSMPGYRFNLQYLDGHDFGELESRKRVCITAVSDGLPDFDWADMKPVKPDTPATVSGILDPANPLDPAYREMAHVRARDNMKHLGYKNYLYYGHETQMVTLPASYGHPKAGTPMIPHPTNPLLQRQVSVNEHAKLRKLPDEMHQALLDVESGKCDLVSSRGSKLKAHRLLGNGVSPRPWHQKGVQLGRFLNLLKESRTPRPFTVKARTPTQLELA